MKIYHGIDDFTKLQFAVVTSGIFDGVHVGHQKIFARLREIASRYHGETVVLTFWPHPRLVLHPEDDSLKLLNTFEEKAMLLKDQGIEHLIRIPFTKEFSQLTSEQFIREILVKTIGTKKLVIGYDHHFGKNREGSFDQLKLNAPKYGFEVEEIPRQDVDHVGVSSTKIRHALEGGDIETATHFLGKPYSLTGRVVSGDKLGRLMGYPTANIEIDTKYKLIPMDGIYAVTVAHEHATYSGMLYIGNRPTINGTKKNIEVNIFNFCQDIYGETLTVSIHKLIRGDVKFSDLEALKHQLKLDEDAANHILKNIFNPLLNSTLMEPPRLLWNPSESLKNGSNLIKYISWLKDHRDLSFQDYHQLWQWSATHVDEFWKSIWDYFNILHDGSYSQVRSPDQMPHVKWFSGTKINYAEHIFRKANDKYPAFIFGSETSSPKSVSWEDLRQQVGSLQHFLKQQGVVTGNRIAAYMPCISEATVGLLASVSLGAIWSSCSPDFGTQAVVDRFAQIEPKVLIAADQYTYNGKVYNKTEVLRDLIKALPSLECVIVVSSKSTFSYDKPSHLWAAVMEVRGPKLDFVRVPFNHPLWVLYSSGTTGLPKPIVHSQGGILLEQLKYGTFHNDFKAGEKCFWYTTTGWMMWNYIHGSLLAGGTMVLYDGSPGFPDLNTLWQFAERAEINHFGTSAGFILANMKEGITPSKFKLPNLRSIGSTGSTLPPEGFDWVYKHVKKDLWLASMSGGTDVCSAFVGGNATWPVYAGEIQCRALGCNLQSFDENGKPVIDEVGEMVVTEPMPSMPVGFWNDPGFKRYRESYFEMFPGVWRHGDWTKITPRHGVIIYGRSDATLNRGGVRIGTSEIYRAVDQVKEVKDSLIICVEKDGGEFWMPLFVVMQDGHMLDDAIKKKVNITIRSQYSPRHVPDEIIAVPDIPYTISGKKTETPVKKVLMGKDPKEVVNAGTLKNPSSMEFFIALAKR